MPAGRKTHPPISSAAHGATNPDGAVMATRPANIPLAHIPGSGLPYRPFRQAHIMAQNAPVAEASILGTHGIVSTLDDIGAVDDARGAAEMTLMAREVHVAKALQRYIVALAK